MKNYTLKDISFKTQNERIDTNFALPTDNRTVTMMIVDSNGQLIVDKFTKITPELLLSFQDLPEDTISEKKT